MTETKAELKYLELCEKEFLECTGIQCRRADSQGRPIVDFFFRNNGLTFENLYLLVSQFKYGDDDTFFLIDSYFDEPLRLAEIAQILKNIQGTSQDHQNTPSVSDQIGQLATEIPGSLTSVLELPRYKTFISRSLPVKPGCENQFTRLILETSSKVQKRMKRFATFDSYMNSNYTQGTSDPMFKGRLTPLLVGLKSFLSKEAKIFKDQLQHFFQTSWQNSDLNSLMALPKYEEQSSRLFDTSLVQLAFAPSGSGKTTSIFQQLSQNYGYYLVSSALNIRAETQTHGHRPNILDPKAIQGPSRDTLTLLKMLRKVNESDKFNIATSLWDNIITTRLEIFQAFRQARGSKASPELWLSLQLDCADWDPFLQYFRLISLAPNSIEWHPHGLDPLYIESRRLLHWICLDEAQEDLRCQLNDSYTMLDIAVHRIIGDLSWERALRKDSTPQTIIAGTSLNIWKALKSIDEVKAFTLFSDSPWVQEPCHIVREYPLVSSEEIAAVVLRAYGIKSERIIHEATKHSTSLWGRVKWTSMYGEKIAVKLTEMELLDCEAISDRALEDLNLRLLADEIFEVVVGDLVRRLAAIKERGDGRELLQKLLEAAISADIRGLPHVFQQESDLELVDHGFALVATDIDDLPSELSRYFEVVSKDANHLTLRLRNDEDVEQGIIYLLAKAGERKFSITECTINQFTSETAGKGLVVADCRPYILPNDKARDGYERSATGRVKTRKDFAAKLQDDFTFDTEETNYLSFAKLKPGSALRTTLAEELKRIGPYGTADVTISELVDLMHNGFTIKNTTLVAKLKERVVIEAVLRFFDSRLVEQLISSIKGVSTRTGLGHPAEHFLAVQLSQFFATLPRVGSRLDDEWQDRRRRVLASLAEAENNVVDKSTVQGLSDSTLILGYQTVKKAGVWDDWVTELQDWLQAIEEDRKPSASFLLPHNDFGPDLIFALRGKDGNVVLCSVQMKLGAGTPDAINKSSISWACTGRVVDDLRKLNEAASRISEVEASRTKWQDLKSRITDRNDLEMVDEKLHEIETKLKNAKEQVVLMRNMSMTHGLNRLSMLLANKFWKQQSKLSLLIAAGHYIPEEMRRGRPETHCDEQYEYYRYFSGTAVEALFGREFLAIADTLEN